MQIIQQQTLPVLHISELSIFFIKTSHNHNIYSRIKTIKTYMLVVDFKM